MGTTSRFGRVLRGLLLSFGTLLAIVLLALVGEGLARALLPDDRGDIFRLFYDNALEYLEPRPNAEKLGPPGGERPLAGLPRLAVVGESSAEMLGFELERIAELCPGQFVVANAGRGGSGLEHVALDFEDVASRRPDVLIFAFGHNLKLVYPTDRRKVRLASLATRSRLIRALTDWLRDPASESAGPVDRLGLYERFLRHAAELSRSQGFTLVVHTMTPNLWLPPNPDGLPLPEALREARWLLARGEVESAAARAREGLEAMRTPGQSILGWYDAATVLAKAGDATGARAAFERAFALDAMSGRARAPTSTNDLVRRVAGEERLVLRDTDRQYSALAADGLPGWECLRDACHLRFEERYLQAVELLRTYVPGAVACALAHPKEDLMDDIQSGVPYEQMLEQSTTGPQAVHAEQALASIFRRLIGSRPSSAHPPLVEMAEGLAVLLTRARPSSAGPSTEILYRAAAEGAWQAGASSLAQLFSSRATDHGKDARTFVIDGLVKVSAGDDAGATASFDRALALDPQDADARFFRARLP